MEIRVMGKSYDKKWEAKEYLAYSSSLHKKSDMSNMDFNAPGRSFNTYPCRSVGRGIQNPENKPQQKSYRHF